MASSPIWERFAKRQLTEPLRAVADPEYAEFAKAVGENRMPVIDSNDKLGATAITFPLLQHFTQTELDSAINFTFPKLNEPLECARSAILATTNTRVAEWNKLIQARTPGEVQHLLSVDRLADAADMVQPELVNAMTDQFLNKMNNHDVPPHDLELKEGDRLLMRNLAHTPALTNNTRVVVRHIGRHHIHAQIISQNLPYRDTIQIVPRIYFRFLPTGMRL